MKDKFLNFFKSNNQNNKHLEMLNGSWPIFSQFGQNIYASDVVQNCIDVIATECSKLRPRHIREDQDGMQHIPRGNLNRLFKFAPNPIMTTSNFLEKIIWLLFMNYNAFIIPMYELSSEKGVRRKNYTALYPINPSRVDFLQDPEGNILVKFNFSSGVHFTLPYSDVIHLRKKFSVNEIMGGGSNGQPDNDALLKVLDINNTALQGLDKAVKSSLAIRGILKVNTLTDDEGVRAERKRIEKLITDGASGILPIDLKGEYIPINADPKFMNKDTLDFLQNKILNWYGVSYPILSGDFTDEQYQAFFEKALEPIIITLGQSFSVGLFTPRELDVGNEVVCYSKNMNYLSTKGKIDLLKITGEQGLLTDNQKLAILGYPPIEGGNKRTISLNYIDVDLANAYQMNRTKKGADSSE